MRAAASTADLRINGRMVTNQAETHRLILVLLIVPSDRGLCIKMVFARIRCAEFAEPRPA